MKRCIPFLLIVALLLTASASAQLNKINMVQLDSLQKVDPRPVVVFIHTDWCTYCASMKQTTFKNAAVIETLNTNFYFVAFNAESKEAIQFRKKTYQYKPTGTNTGIHELAIALGSVQGELMYPTTCILNKKNKPVYRHAGYANADTMLQLLQKNKD